MFGFLKLPGMDFENKTVYNKTKNAVRIFFIKTKGEIVRIKSGSYLPADVVII